MPKGKLCNFIVQKQTNTKGKFALSNLWATVQVLSTPLAYSTVVSSVKVNSRPWVTVHFSLGTSVLRNRINLGIYIHTSRTHIRLLYFKHKQLNDQSNMELQRINVFHVQI